MFASTGELLDRDSSRLRVRSSGHSSKFSLPNLLERDAVRLARERERERERSASSDVLLSTSPAVSTTMLSSGGSVTDGQPPSGAEDDMDGGEWDRMVITRMSSKRRSSVPDTREERGSAEAAAAAEPRSTTLPRSATALSAAADNELLDLELSGGAGSSPSISASTAGVKKSLSLLLGHSGTNNSTSESSLNTSVDTPVRSARYRPPGFRGTQLTQHQQQSPQHSMYEMSPTATPTALSVRSGQRGSSTPQRAPSAPRLGFGGESSLTPRSSGSAASFSSRRNVRSMLAGKI